MSEAIYRIRDLIREAWADGFYAASDGEFFPDEGEVTAYLRKAMASATVRAALRPDSPVSDGTCERCGATAPTTGFRMILLCGRCEAASIEGERFEHEIDAWLTYHSPGRGIVVREYEVDGRTWYRDGEGMDLAPGESIKVRILLPRNRDGCDDV